jgi:hypothetical protein
MKKIVMCLVVLLAAAPAMALPDVNVVATQVGDTAEVDITAETFGSGAIPRAFALDITVDAGQIVGISNFFSGECSTGAKGYGIFPANFNRFIDADDPCWGEPNYTPVADACDLPGDTQPGIPGTGITIEMGSLYKGANSPPNPSTLCRIEVSQDCNVALALNIGRGKIVLEDGNEPASVDLTGCKVTIVCTVPNVIDMAEAAACAAIEAAGFVCDTTTLPDDYDDVIVLGNVISQLPSGGATPGCGSTVQIATSLGPCVVPDIYNLSKADANTAIENAGFTVGSITGECNDVITAGNVTGQSPAAGGTPGCGSTVDYTVSTGPCCTYPACWDYLTQCHGDVDNDVDVDIVDWPEFRDGFGATYPASQYLAHPCADFDRDGDIDIVDWPHFRDNFGKTPASDCTQGDINAVYCP